MIQTPNIFIAFSLFFLCICPRTSTAQAVKLVTVETGDLPIILSAPHGGGKDIAGVAERQGVGIKAFRNKPDSRTDRLTEQIAVGIEKRLGKRPYVVIARFHRKYLDVNRPRRLAYESEAAKATYDTYHQALARAREDIVDRWGRGLLLDIHGQAANSKAIFRGTQNGKTTTHLISRFGRRALIGETSLFGEFAKQGIPVIPDVDATDREDSNYDGGFTVVTYGRETMDAIQLELGMELRSPSKINSTANKLASAIVEFANTYLPSAELSPSE